MRKALAVIVGTLGAAAMLWGAWALFVLVIFSGEYQAAWLPPYVAFVVFGGFAAWVSRRIWRGR